MKLELPSSELELMFGLEHPGLRSYMYSCDNTVADFSEHMDAMAKDDHPLVRYGAGWAAAELALYRIRPNDYGSEMLVLPYRQEFLAAASEHWQAASKDIGMWRGEQQTPESASQARVVEMRLAQAIAYIPLMEVAASWFADKPMGRRPAVDKQQAALQQTSRVALGVSYLQESDFVGDVSKADLASEVLCGLVCQITKPQKYTSIPSPLRNGRLGQSRSDFYTVIRQLPYRRKPLRATPERVSADELVPSTLQISALHDFGLESHQAIYTALRSFHELASGTLKPHLATKLEKMGRSMASRLDGVVF